jgi:hypothetical protein
MIGKCNISNSVRIPVISPMHKVGLPFAKRRGGINTPTDIEVLTVSSTIVSAIVTNNATNYDGFSWEYSTDNINWSVHGTSTSPYYDYDSLTTATTYYFRVRAYKGSSYSDYSDVGSTTTFNSAMITGWKFDEEVDYAFSNILGEKPFSRAQYSAAQYYNGVTYISYFGDSDDPYIISYTHITDTWSTPVKIGTNPKGDSDDHGEPIIFVDSSGYIHCMWGAHNSDLLYAKSDNPEDISAWTAMTAPVTTPEVATYPSVFQTSDNKLWLFYRSNGGVTSYWGYKTSTNGGTSWSAYVALSQDIAYWIFRKGIGDTFHAVGYGNNQTSADRKNIYYIYYNGTNWVNISGSVQPSPIVLAGNNCLAYNSGDYYNPVASINFDTSNNPYIVFSSSTIELDNTNQKTRFLKHNGAEWVVTDVGPVGEIESMLSPDIDIVGSELHIYTNNYGKDDPFEAQLEKWVSDDIGVTWYCQEIISHGICYQPVLVRNYNSDAKLLFSEYRGNDSLFVNCGFLWGDSGFIGNVTGLTVASINRVYSGNKNSGLLLAVGRYGNCYDFKGSPDTIIVQDADSISFAGGTPDLPFSISFWLKTSDTVTNQRILEKGKGGGGVIAREYMVRVEDNKIHVFCMIPDATSLITASAPFAITGTWAFICVTYDGGGSENGFEIYINGIASKNAQSETGTYVGMTNGSYPLYIGCYKGASNFLVGLLDELKIWNKVLTPTEIGYVMNNNAGW